MNGKLFAAIALLAFAVLLAWWWTGDGGDSGSAARDDETESRVARESSAEADTRIDPIESADLDTTPTFERELPVFPIRRPLGEIRGRVIDNSDYALPGARVKLKPSFGGLASAPRISDDRTVTRSTTADADGYYSFERVPVGPYILEADAEGGFGGGHAMVVHEGPATEETVLKLYGGAWEPLVVRVVDAAGAPVPGCRVDVAGLLRGRLRVGAPRLTGDGSADFHEESVHGTTDGDGTVEFPDHIFNEVMVVARAPSGATATRTLMSPSGLLREIVLGGVELVLASPGALEGRIHGADATSLVGSRVRVHCLSSLRLKLTSFGFFHEVTVKDGSYRVDGLAAGTYLVTFEGDSGSRVAGDGGADFATRDLHVDVGAGETSILDLHVTEGGSLRGRVVDVTGRPLRDAVVTTLFQPRLHFVDGWLRRHLDRRVQNPSHHPLYRRRARTDAEGRYSLMGLVPGDYLVEIEERRHSSETLYPVRIEDGAAVDLAHSLEAAGVLQGVSAYDGYLAVTRLGETEPRIFASLPRHRSFTFFGLPAGRYSLSHHARSMEPISLGEATVIAGETTWVDLRDARGPIEISGTVIAVDGPLEGATIRVGTRQTVTDRHGRFTEHVLVPWTQQVSIRVEHGGVETTFMFPGMARNARTWEGELRLGPERLIVETLDADGRPIAARVSLAPVVEPVADRVRLAGLYTIAEADTGRAVIEHLYPQDACPVYAFFPDGYYTTVMTPIPAAGPIVMRSVATGNVIVHALDEHGLPLFGWHVDASVWIGEGAPPPGPIDPTDLGGRRFAATVDRDGRALLRGLPEGDVEISLDRAHATLDTHRVELPDPITIRVTPGATVEVQFTVSEEQRAGY